MGVQHGSASATGEGGQRVLPGGCRVLGSGAAVQRIRQQQLRARVTGGNVAVVDKNTGPLYDSYRNGEELYTLG